MIFSGMFTGLSLEAIYLLVFWPHQPDPYPGMRFWFQAIFRIYFTCIIIGGLLCSKYKVGKYILPFSPHKVDMKTNNDPNIPNYSIGRDSLKMHK